MTDEELEKMGFGKPLYGPSNPRITGKSAAMEGLRLTCEIDRDRLKAGVAGAKQIILTNEKQLTGEWNTLEAEYAMREAIKNLKIFLGIDDKTEGE